MSLINIYFYNLFIFSVYVYFKKNNSKNTCILYIFISIFASFFNLIIYICKVGNNQQYVKLFVMSKKPKIPIIQKVIITYSSGDVFTYAMPSIEARKYFTDLVKLYLDYPFTGIYSISIVDNRGVPYRSYIINYNKPSYSSKYERV